MEVICITFMRTRREIEAEFTKKPADTVTEDLDVTVPNPPKIEDGTVRFKREKRRLNLQRPWVVPI